MLPARRRVRGISCAVIGNYRISHFPPFWVKEVNQTGTLARHNTQKGQKCCDNHSSFKYTVHKGRNFHCSMIITHIARRRIPHVPQGFIRFMVGHPTALLKSPLGARQSSPLPGGGGGGAPKSQITPPAPPLQGHTNPTPTTVQVHVSIPLHRTSNTHHEQEIAFCQKDCLAMVAIQWQCSPPRPMATSCHIGCTLWLFPCGSLNSTLKDAGMVVLQSLISLSLL